MMVLRECHLLQVQMVRFQSALWMIEIALTEQMTHIASYSNWGPRLSDGDDDDWDELKPDITSYGTGINSASAVKV